MYCFCYPLTCYPLPPSLHRAFAAEWRGLRTWAIAQYCTADVPTPLLLYAASPNYVPYCCTLHRPVMYHIFQSCIARTADECRSSPAHILYPSFSTPPILLCMSYASSGTDTAYAATQYLLSSESLTASKVVPASFCTYPRSICLLLYCPMQYQPASVCQCLGTGCSLLLYYSLSN